MLTPRDLRDVLLLGLAWSAAMAAIFSGLVAVIRAFHPEVVDPGEGPADVWKIGATVGLVSGIAFGGLLLVAERTRRLAAVSLGRAAVWGILAAALFPLVTGRQSQVVWLCPVGAGLAVLTIVVVRRFVERVATPAG